MPDPIDRRCPVCQSPIDVPTDHAGAVLCLRCGTRVEGPAGAKPVAVAEPPPVEPPSPVSQDPNLDDTVAALVVVPQGAREAGERTEVAPGGRPVEGAAAGDVEPVPAPLRVMRGRRRWAAVAFGVAVAVGLTWGAVRLASILIRGGVLPVDIADAVPPTAPAEPAVDVTPSPSPAGVRLDEPTGSAPDSTSRPSSPPSQPPPTPSPLPNVVIVTRPRTPVAPRPAAGVTEPTTKEAAPVPTPPVAPPVPAPPAVAQTVPASAEPSPAAPPGRPAIARPEPVRLPPVVREVTDEEIGVAIQKGVDWIIGAPGAATRAQIAQAPAPFPRGEGGPMVLAVFALLQCGKSIDDPRLDITSPSMASLVDAMKKSEDMRPSVYSRSLRAQALSLFNRKEDRAALVEDVRFLIAAGRDGRYTYEAPLRTATGRQGRLSWWDNSNSQFGLLGVWAGAEAGIEVENRYWAQVEQHWRTCQGGDGQWGYTNAGRLARPSMTAAGTTSLFVAQEYLELARPPRPELGRPPLTPPLERAMNWWAQGNNAMVGLGSGYTLYGVGRVGLASGYKHLGVHDWYRSLAARAIAKQNADGSWGSASLIETSFHLLFLARGRHPILMNKLAYDGFWANRPRDTANLAKYAGKRLEREFNWQVVNLAADWTDWLDSPILYIGGHAAPKFAEKDLEKLRAYVHSGGMIFTNADGGTEAFNAFAADLATKLFPPYELTTLPPSHPVYSVLFEVKQGQPALKGVRNGARLLMVHSPDDIARAWQRRDHVKNRALFETGVNLFVYAAGKRDFRNRLDIGYWDAHPATPTATVPVARVRYAGNWDPEPGAWRHYAGWFKQHTGMALDVRDVALKDLTPDVAPVAHLTGTVSHTFTEDERAALRAYVEAGGVLVADPCGGGKPFVDAVREGVLAAFPSSTFARLPRAHPLLNKGPAGMDDLTSVQLRLSTLDRRNANNTYEALRAGRGCVLLAPFDVTCGLLNANAWEVRGYAPAYAQSLMKNTIFWAMDGQAELAGKQIERPTVVAGPEVFIRSGVTFQRVGAAADVVGLSQRRASGRRR